MESVKLNADLINNRVKAVRKIQTAWRRHIDMNLFKYYRSLISFKGKGDPRSLLRCINPREAELIDAAAGVYVRFRLGGVTFPPNIFYKLFTHRPIVDMCANSPRDYTSQASKQILPQDIHNYGQIPIKDSHGWYKRMENNGWRALELRPWSNLSTLMFDDTNRKIEFHYSKLKRRQDVERRNKQRKIEWMKKMYYEGSLHAETSEPDTALLIQRATQGLLNSAELHGSETVMDWEVDELLNWTNGLNFEEYIGDWKQTGTSKSSAAYREQVSVLWVSDGAQSGALLNCQKGNRQVQQIDCNDMKRLKENLIESSRLHSRDKYSLSRPFDDDKETAVERMRRTEEWAYGCRTGAYIPKAVYAIYQRCEEAASRLNGAKGFVHQMVTSEEGGKSFPEKLYQLRIAETTVHERKLETLYYPSVLRLLCHNTIPVNSQQGLAPAARIP